MIQAVIRAKAQTTVPPEVREALGVREGDRIMWTLDGDRAVVERLKPAGRDPFETPFAAFTEWADPIDTEDFADF
jgi:bifunctional DNA-binding transcriptional regulator/antitoxin component of YhaV-PrlF toxin-antitoxin module